jgi:hypothetical protein
MFWRLLFFLVSFGGMIMNLNFALLKMVGNSVIQNKNFELFIEHLAKVGRIFKALYNSLNFSQVLTKLVEN